MCAVNLLCDCTDLVFQRKLIIIKRMEITFFCLKCLKNLLCKI